jgi:hypothetical protein
LYPKKLFERTFQYGIRAVIDKSAEFRFIGDAGSVFDPFMISGWYAVSALHGR